MKFNDYKERRKFMTKQIELQQQYREAGMSEADIREMFIHDLAYYKSCRREALHTVPMSKADNVVDPKSNTTSIGWLEEIDNPDLYQAIQNMPDNWREIIEMILDGLTQEQIAKRIGIKQQNVSKKVIKIKKILKNFL